MLNPNTSTSLSKQRYKNATPLLSLVLKPPPIQVLRKWWSIIGYAGESERSVLNPQYITSQFSASNRISKLSVQAKTFFPHKLSSAISSNIITPRYKSSSAIVTRLENTSLIRPFSGNNGRQVFRNVSGSSSFGYVDQSIYRGPQRTL